MNTIQAKQRIGAVLAKMAPHPGYATIIHQVIMMKADDQLLREIYAILKETYK